MKKSNGIVANQKIKIRVVYARNPPDAFDNCIAFPTFSPTFKCPFPGWTMEILTMIIQSLNYEMVPIVTSSPVGSVNWGTLTNHSWTGMLGYLFNGSADVVCLLYQYTSTRSDYFSYSYNVYNVKPVYVVKKLNYELSANLWNSFTVYSGWVWVAIIAALIIQIGYSIFIAHVEWNLNLRETFNPLDTIWRYVRLQLTQPEDFEFFSFSGNLTLIVFSLLQAKIMMMLYQALLLSAILRPVDINPFDSADDVIDLVAKGEYKLITNYIGNWYFDDLANSEASHFKRLRAAIQKNPVIVASSVKSVLDYVELGGYIFPIQEDSLAMQMSKQRCGLTYISNGLPEKEAYFAFQKNSTLLPAFNRAVIGQTEFIIRTYNKYLKKGYKMGDLPKCPVDTGGGSDSSMDTLSLVTFFGIFFVCFIGFGLSIFIFAFEIYVAWQHKIIKLRLKARRAMTEPIHLMGIASMFVDVATQRVIDKTLTTPTLDERKQHANIAETEFL